MVYIILKYVRDISFTTQYRTTSVWQLLVLIAVWAFFFMGTLMDYTKVCTGCQEEFPATAEYFHKQKGGKYELRANCKFCVQKNIDKKARSKYYKKYYQENRRKIIEKQLAYIKENRDKVNSRHNARYGTDISYKIKHNMKRRMNLALKGYYKSETTRKLIGCDDVKLRTHLEKQFTVGMNWNNYGDWHIDHIIPCANFDLTDPEQQKKCFHYSNLQPLWAVDNLRKSDKVPDSEQ